MGIHSAECNLEPLEKIFEDYSPSSDSWFQTGGVNSERRNTIKHTHLHHRSWSCQGSSHDALGSAILSCFVWSDLHINVSSALRWALGDVASWCSHVESIYISTLVKIDRCTVRCHEVFPAESLCPLSGTPQGQRQPVSPRHFTLSFITPVNLISSFSTCMALIFAQLSTTSLSILQPTEQLALFHWEHNYCLFAQLPHHISLLFDEFFGGRMEKKDNIPYILFCRLLKWRYVWMYFFPEVGSVALFYRPNQSWWAVWIFIFFE